MHQAMRFNRTNLRARVDRVIQFAHVVVVAHVFADHALNLKAVVKAFSLWIKRTLYRQNA